MAELTYFLGAGASCFSMPMVADFPTRFNFFIDLITNSIVRITKDEFVSDCYSFLQQLNGHLSFDTYFKKLYHQNRISEISKYKKILLIYFVFEHLIIPENFNELTRPNGYTLKKSFINDPRYDALIAGLLKPIKGKSEFLSNVNFITWNYDLNLMIALKNFEDDSLPISEFMKTKEKLTNYFQFDNGAKVYHLNGYINDSSIIDGFGMDWNKLQSKLANLIELYQSNDITLTKSSECIKFSWEGISQDNPYDLSKTDSKVMESIALSETIVVIGYSFPLYNRFFDKHFFSPNNIRNKKIYIQDPGSSVLAENFKEYFDLDRVAPNGIPMIKDLGDCRSFFVPKNMVL